ncbi:MAG: hypothetical protein RLZZ428_619 [Pseudomonadota bacterium]|jgi:hypothetical protein
MVKLIQVWLILAAFLWGQTSFERHCVECHQEFPVSLQQIMLRYLVLYSSEQNVKGVMKLYLKNPMKELSAMSNLFVKTYGIKEKTDLTEEELNEALEGYWEKYKVLGKLK